MNRIETRPASRSGKQLLILICACLIITLRGEAYGQDNPDPLRFEQEITTFDRWDEKNATPKSPVVFVGSSSIRMWPSARHFPDLPVVNRGFGGSHISDVLYYIDETVFRYSPRAIVFYAGDNDVADGKAPERVAQDFRDFAEHVHSVLPVTKIFYLPIKPSLSRWSVWPEMEEANSLIRKACADDRYLVYIDTASPMIVDGKPSPALFLDDGLHLNEEGYVLWTDVVTTALRGHQIY